MFGKNEQRNNSETHLEVSVKSSKVPCRYTKTLVRFNCIKL